MSQSSGFDESEQESLKLTGTIHLISVSGLHFLFLSVTLFTIFSITPIPRSVVWWIVAGVMLIYGLASGLHAPVIRSMSVILIVQAAPFVRKEFDLWSALAAVAIVYLGLNPRTIFDVGFQMSFVTVACFGLVPRLDEHDWKTRLFHEAKSVGVAFLATLPLLAYYQGFVGWTSPLANLLTILVLPWVLIGSLGSYLVSSILPGLAVSAMQLIVYPLVGWIELCLSWLSIPEAKFTFPAFSGYFLLLLYGFVMLAWRRKRIEA